MIMEHVVGPKYILFGHMDPQRFLNSVQVTSNLLGFV